MAAFFQLLAGVLRDPVGVVEQTDDPEVLARRIPHLLAMAAGGAALFGIVVGSYRGGLQVPYAALKMPLLLWIPVMLTLPATRALWAASGQEVSWRRTSVAGLVAMARMGVLAAAAGPALWLIYSVQPDYHLSVLLLAASLVVVGLPGLTVLMRALPGRGLRTVLAGAASLFVLGICTAQTGWLLRPFIARPTAEVALFRPIEEDIFSSLSQTSRSAVGVYDGWDVESRGILRQQEQGR